MEIVSSPAEWQSACSIDVGAPEHEGATTLPNLCSDKQKSQGKQNHEPEMTIHEVQMKTIILLIVEQELIYKELSA